MEKEIEDVLMEEVKVVISKDIMIKLRQVFDSCKERGFEHVDEVETTELVSSIAEDSYFERHLDMTVRINVDREKESLESLLHRVLKEHKEPRIKWTTFLSFFSKRGRLREHEQMELIHAQENTADGMDELMDISFHSDESFETKHYRLTKQFKQKMV